MLINRKIGNYVLLRRLAVGGQSEVFLAMKDGPGEYSRPVVIKALPTRYRHDPKFVELFHREAFLSSRFSHPHVVTVHDARVLDGEQCMIMDFITGQTVADIAQRSYKAGDPLSMTDAVRIVGDACDGLNYTHHFRDLDKTEYPVVHRDVSPQNLMVTYQGVTLVFDYGIAKIVGEESEVDTLAGGKYAYMSPEQCLGEEVDTRSDIFSIGVILYELTVGTRLFRRPSKEKVIEAVTEEEIKPPGAIRAKFPPMLEDVIMKALQRDPDRRYQTAGRMRDDLRDFLAVQPGKKGRAGLGKYIAELFEEERAVIADVVQKASEIEEEPKPKDGIPLEELGRENRNGDGEDPAVPMPEPKEDEELAEKLAAEEKEPSEDEAATEWEEKDPGVPEMKDVASGGTRGEDVERQLESLKKRQSILLIALGIVSIVAILLSIFAAFGGGESPDQKQPVEIGASK